jgi:hypothetical protein
MLRFPPVGAEEYLDNLNRKGSPPKNNTKIHL